MPKKSIVRQQLWNLLSDSKLEVTEKIEYEGKYRDDDETDLEKERLLNEIIKIVYPKTHIP